MERKEKTIIEMHLKEKDKQLLTDFLIMNKIEHAIYTFEIGTICRVVN